jgi:hypothetical protein
MKLKKDAKSVMDVDDLYFVEGIRSHYAVNKIMEKYGADAITIQCLMLKHRKPCVSFSINNGNLVPCGCENHLDGTLTQMLGRWLFERGGSCTIRNLIPATTTILLPIVPAPQS